MSWSPYNGEAYLDADAVEAWCISLAETHPEWVTVVDVGKSRHGRPLQLLTLGNQAGQPEDHPAFWMDGGTHASEWTSVMCTLYAVSRWIETLVAGDEAAVRWFSEQTIYVLPCISPDGMQAMHDGAPMIRSALRPPRPGAPRVGLSPQDVDGDGVVRWMRWKHPAGSMVADPASPIRMRRRRLEDDPSDAFFLTSEGSLLHWDGVAWVQAPLEFGVDLNRNFPSHWKPFSMFGMDAGAYPTSEPESQAVVAAFAARTQIGAALSCHTYTGALLTQPYRGDSPLPSSDIRMMAAMAEQAVDGTGYKVYKVHPDFTYDPKTSIVGVWSDTIASTFGVPGYTLELWDPFGAAGIAVDKPAEFFLDPDDALMATLFEHIASQPGAVTPWAPFEHPQLGTVEIGGIDYMHTIRNPPVHLLEAECAKGFTVAERLRRSMPRPRAALRAQAEEGLTRLSFTLLNEGFLATHGLAHGDAISAAPGVSAALVLGDGLTLVDGPAVVDLPQLEGWGSAQFRGAGHPVYPSLPLTPQRAEAVWWVRGSGTATVWWSAGRGGTGQSHLDL